MTTSNFVSSMSLTPDFGNLIVSSNSGQFTVFSEGIVGSALFTDFDFSSTPTSELWFSLPNNFPCAASNVLGIIQPFCSGPPSQTNANTVLVFKSAFTNAVTAWMPFYNVSLSGNVMDCDIRLDFQGLFS